MMKNKLLLVGTVSCFIIIAAMLFSCKDNKSNIKKDNRELIERAKKDDKVLDSLIMADSTNAEWYSMRAALMFDKGRLTDAYSDINIALQSKGDNIPDLLVLSDIYFAMGKPAFARSALRRAEEIDNTDYTVYYALGRHHMLNGNFALAKGNFEKSAEMFPNPQSYFQLGYMSLLNGDTTEAINYFQKSVQIDNTYYNGYLQLAVIYMDKDRVYVPEYLRNVLDNKPDLFEALYLFGIFHEQNKEHRKAIEYFKSAYNVNPNNQYSPFNIGYIYLTELLVFDSAEYWFSKALEADTSFKEAKHNLDYAIELQNKD